MKPPLSLSLLPLALGLCSASHAADPVFTLGEIKVVASPTAGPLGSESVELEDIRTHDRKTVGDAADLLPGVHLSRVGARNEQMLYLRGFDLRQVPVYVDGIPVYVPYDGYVDLGRFSTYDLSRIEVSKGFSSTLYGANTLGGAINLVSRRPVRALEGEVGVGLGLTNKGEHNGSQMFANVGGKREAWYFQVGAAWTQEDYFRLPGSFTPAKGEDGGRRDNSYQKDQKLNLKLGLTPNATDEYTFNVVHQHGVKGVPPYAGTLSTARYWQWPYWDKDSIYFLSSTQVGEHKLKVRLYHDTFKNSLFTYDNATYTTQKLRSSFQSWYDDYTNGMSVEGDFKLTPANTLRTALHWKQDVHREHNAGEPIRTNKDRTTSVALEDTHVLSPKWSVVSGLTYSERDTLRAEDLQNGVLKPFALGTNSATNGQVGVFYQPSDTGRMHATVAQKSRFPTIKDRYSYRLGTAIPNADLKTEEATHFEVGYADRWGANALWEVNVFHSNITNLIQSVSLPATACSSPPCSQMQNVGKATAGGVELGLRGGSGAWEYTTHYTWLERKNKSNAQKLTDTPRHKLFASATWKPSAQWSATGSVTALSSRFSSSNGAQVAGGFAVANLKAGYHLSGGSVVEVGVNNLFDRLYAYSEGFYEPGRNVFVQWRTPF